MTLRRDAQNHSKMVSLARLPVRYCITVTMFMFQKIDVKLITCIN